jgi:YfiH family protein
MTPLAAPSLAALPRIVHGFFGRRGGVSGGIYTALNCGGRDSGDDPAAILENRRRVGASLGGELVTLRQVHSPATLYVSAPFPGPPPEADALVTDVPGLAIGALTADCAPVLMADAEAGVIGAAHAGWGGALGGILESCLAEMERRGARRARIRAAIGPCIQRASYQVDGVFREKFLSADPANARHFMPDGRRWRFDLPGYAAERLAAAGLVHVESLGADTYAEEEAYFSFRRTTHRSEPDYGRQVSAILLRA